MHESSFCLRLFLLVAAPTTLEVVGDRWKSLCDSFVHQHQPRAPGTPIERSKLDSAGKSYLRAWGGGSASLYARILYTFSFCQSAQRARVWSMCDGRLHGCWFRQWGGSSRMRCTQNPACSSHSRSAVCRSLSRWKDVSVSAAVWENILGEKNWKVLQRFGIKGEWINNLQRLLGKGPGLLRIRL